MKRRLCRPPSHALYVSIARTLSLKLRASRSPSLCGAAVKSQPVGLGTRTIGFGYHVSIARQYYPQYYHDVYLVVVLSKMGSQVCRVA